MTTYPPNPVAGSAISARQFGRLADVIRDGHIAGGPGIRVDGTAGASTITPADDIPQDEWFNPFPFGPMWPFGLAFREPDPEGGTHPRVRVFSGTWRYRETPVMAAQADLLVQDAYRTIVLKLKPDDSAPTLSIAMWDEACDYTDADDDVATIHDKDGFIYIPLAVCFWSQRTIGEVTTAFAFLKKWWLPCSYPTVF